MEESLLKELKGSILFFIKERSFSRTGYGLMKDRLPNTLSFYSIAATGFALSALPLAVEYGLLSLSGAREEAAKTLTTLESIPSEEGFYYHFYAEDGERMENSELSSIDSTLLYLGMIFIGEYFQGEIKQRTETLLERVNWPYFADPSKKWFFMGKRDGRFYSYWNTYSEQLALYVLAASSTNEKHVVGKEYYDNMKKLYGSYHGIDFIYSWYGSLFTHFFSSAYLDLRGYKDEAGTDYFKNTELACQASYLYCLDNPLHHKGYGASSWGLSSCDTPHGYIGNLGTPPSGLNDTCREDEGSIACYASLSSFPYTEKEATTAFDRMIKIPGLDGEYGLRDSYNEDENWVSESYLGIDKGVGMLSLANYDREIVWKYMRRNAGIQRGLMLLRIKKEG